MPRWAIVATVLSLLIALGGGLHYLVHYADVDIYIPRFNDQCADCHGKDLRGTDVGPSLIDRRLKGGDNIAALMASIRHRHDQHGSPLFSPADMTDEEAKGLSIFVGERRLGQVFSDFRTSHIVEIPDGPVRSEEHTFSIEVVAGDLSPAVFSIAPLPDGDILLTENVAGLSLISLQDGEKTLIAGTPETSDRIDTFRGLNAGVGWLLDVAIHPDYSENGWIYLHYTELCTAGCEDGSPVMPSSMNRLDRGRIRNGQWVDVEHLWFASPEYYRIFPDTAAGGRIAFDDAGHVFLSVGFKETLGLGAQDLDSPYGKIHRITEDGKIPPDNPFVISDHNAAKVPFTKQSIWTYGHRTPQGLEWNPARSRLWNAEMGPRGGDEINELLPGQNYGWPYHSLGLEYTGAKVQRYRVNDVEFDESTIKQTLVDFTPSPAISSFIFYEGEAFENWQHNLLLGTLKGNSLYRLVFDGDQLVHKELVFNDLARIRDIEVGFDGLIYLLLENNHGSMIVRLVPQSRESLDFKGLTDSS